MVYVSNTHHGTLSTAKNHQHYEHIINTRLECKSISNTTCTRFEVPVKCKKIPSLAENIPQIINCATGLEIVE